MILIFPWSRNTTDGKSSPKNYSQWPQVAASLVRSGYHVVQVSRSGEPGIPGLDRKDDLPLSAIAAELRGCETWLSCDSFVPHFAMTLGEPGVVLFGPSDPEIFGHPPHINLLGHRKHLREWQFRHWNQVEPNPAAFVSPGVVITATQLSIAKRKALAAVRK